MVKKTASPFVLLVCSMMLAACDSTPPAVSTLMQQVAQACQTSNSEALRACYAREGVTAEQIDQQLGSWDAYLTKTDPAYQWTYSGITYVSLADAPNNKSILPDTIAMAQVTTMADMKFGPNIKVLGFILVSFKQAGGTEGGQTEPVGLASDGTAKIALVEPLH